MIEILMVHFIFQIFRFSIPANQLPWNTTGVGGNLNQAPNIILENIPWFFPFITLVLLLATDYVFALKKGVDTKANFFAVASVYTFLAYVEVAGSLTTSGYFYIFEFIMIVSVFIMTLFSSTNP